MTAMTQYELTEKLADIHQLSPDIRFGELLANLGFLVEDDRLLAIMEQHRADLARREADR